MNNEISCVMLIDDHHPTNVLHRLAIERCKCAEKVIIFENGFDALAYLKEPFGVEHPKPDIIFLDVNMPGLTGWEFLEEYKNLLEQKKSHSLLLMLSTSSHPEDLERAKEETIVKGYIYKPLTAGMVKNIIEKYFKKTNEKRA